MKGREEACAPETQDQSAAIRTISSRDLLGGRAVLRIEHEGELYTLRLTRNNRLILTK
jgi:hemin uptake protein HemP